MSADADNPTKAFDGDSRNGFTRPGEFVVVIAWVKPSPGQRKDPP